MKYIPKRKKKKQVIKYSLFSVRQFLFIFSVIAAVITVSFCLFFHNNLEFVFELLGLKEEIKIRGLQNFFNVVFISFVISIIYNLIRNYTIKIPVRKILEATHKITRGDFSARINLGRIVPVSNEFDIIVEDFNKMAQELNSIETLKTDFIANVSHELKTPLTVIQNYSTMLQNPDLSDKERTEYADALSSASSNLSELITGILRLNKLENQQIFPEKKTFNLSEQLCECMLRFEKEWEEKHLTIETDFDEELTITGDYELLSLVWSNLISNAIKFSYEGKKIFLKVKKERGRATVTVRDEGKGIAESALKRIFEKFYQEDTSRSTKGNGIGLALVKRVIDIADGEIEVLSKEGEGTTFIVTLR